MTQTAFDVVMKCEHPEANVTGACVNCVEDALATARREGAQEMRERCVTVASNETEYAARANMVERYSGCYDVTAKIRALPLEKEKS